MAHRVYRCIAQTIIIAASTDTKSNQKSTIITFFFIIKTAHWDLHECIHRPSWQSFRYDEFWAVTGEACLTALAKPPLPPTN
jgi:hypothetical protein